MQETQSSNNNVVENNNNANENVNESQNAEIAAQNFNNDNVDVETVIDEKQENEEAPEYWKRNFRKLERKIKRENRDLSNQLSSAVNELNQYREFFSQVAQGQSQQEEVQQPADLESAVKNVLHQAERERQQQLHSQSIAQASQRLQQDFQSELEKASERYDDFEDVMEQSVPHFTKPIANVAQLLPNAGDVLYSLGKNKAELQRITKLSDIEQAKEIFNYAVKLAQGKSPKISNAPAPLSNSQVKNKPATTADPAQMDIAQLKAYLKSKTNRR